jgi:hypothetical protein
MEKIKKIKSQINALNKRLEKGKVKNIYALQNKIKTLENDLKIEIDRFNVEVENNYWERCISY